MLNLSAVLKHGARARPAHGAFAQDAAGAIAGRALREAG
ncbi:hypothetical protein ACRB68_58200 [Actinomadura sp. RB68]|uniref:Uncharacterized protein n=1 Tax=Actinomadura macrotermitis TaxID=2585200 RepID=A0A7K0C2S6_9ACTN|nr:hypothetical protein [Actinomadura macrotermitis]